MSKEWAVDHAARIAAEVKRLRGSRSGQWLSDRTAELGYRVSRTTISELENGRRRYVTTAEIAVLAEALETAPIALIYPPRYDTPVERLPGVKTEKLSAVEWFCGTDSRLPNMFALATARDCARSLSSLAAFVYKIQNDDSLGGSEGERISKAFDHEGPLLRRFMNMLEDGEGQGIKLEEWYDANGFGDGR